MALAEMQKQTASVIVGAEIGIVMTSRGAKK